MTSLACKNCRVRKVKCDREHPCRLCLHSGLPCRYSESRPKVKPHRGPGAKILTQLRRESESPERSRDSSGNRGNATLLPEELIKTCIFNFFDEIYPNMPIISQSIRHLNFSSMEANTETYGLVAAVCALTLLQPMTTPWPEKKALQQGRYCLSEAERSRTLYNHIENATVDSVVTSYLIHSCYYALHLDRSSSFYLREAITLAQIYGMDQESSYESMEPDQEELQRRVFWLLFITERAHGLLRRRPIILKPSIRLPKHDNLSILQGFISLIKLYENVDHNVVEPWTNHRLPIQPSFLVDLNYRLSLCSLRSSCTNSSQLADLLITQRWLQIIAWQLGLSRKILSSKASTEALGLDYPIHIAKNLICDVAALPKFSIEVHGEDLVEKIFDIACTVTDIVNCYSSMNTDLKASATAYLAQFLHMICSFHDGHTKFRPLLIGKMQSTNSVLVASPLLLTCPTNLHAWEKESEDSNQQDGDEHLSQNSV